jgi:hypothetical protein
MSQMGFKPTTQGFERAKTVHALDRAASAIGFLHKESELAKINY